VAGGCFFFFIRLQEVPFNEAARGLLLASREGQTSLQYWSSGRESARVKMGLRVIGLCFGAIRDRVMSARVGRRLRVSSAGGRGTLLRLAAPA
jgi:hypothetical protein